jgi:hypothetical protein
MRWEGAGEARPVLYSSRAVADCANWAAVGGREGDCVVGEVGPDWGFFCGGAPPHCDMKERTVRERTERNISGGFE